MSVIFKIMFPSWLILFKYHSSFFVSYTYYWKKGVICELYMWKYTRVGEFSSFEKKTACVYYTHKDTFTQTHSAQSSVPSLRPPRSFCRLASHTGSHDWGGWGVAAAMASPDRSWCSGSGYTSTADWRWTSCQSRHYCQMRAKRLKKIYDHLKICQCTSKWPGQTD